MTLLELRSSEVDDYVALELHGIGSVLAGLLTWLVECFIE
jgi:hypothetical protein